MRMFSRQQVSLLVVIAHNLINKNECMLLRYTVPMYGIHNDVNLVVKLGWVLFLSLKCINGLCWWIILVS